MICDVESNLQMSILLDNETEVRTEVILVDVFRSEFIGVGTGPLELYQLLISRSYCRSSLVRHYVSYDDSIQIYI